MPTATSGASRRGEEPPDQRQTGLCSMQRPVILSPGLPPDFSERPTGRQTASPTAGLSERQTASQTGLPYRQPYLKLSPAGSHGSSLPDGFIRQTYRQVSFQRPDRPASPVARPAASPASHTSLPYRQPYRQPDRQPNQPAQPTSPTDQPDQPPSPPSTPAKVPPAYLTGRLRSAGRRLRGWR